MVCVNTQGLAWVTLSTFLPGTAAQFSVVVLIINPGNLQGLQLIVQKAFPENTLRSLG